MADLAAPRHVETLHELLDLEELDRDLYRAHNPRESFTPHHLFGGQVAAQAIRAAASTVPEGRYPHSMHGYFLRSGEADHPTIMRVTHDRDGRSFSARHVVALQRGEAIFTTSVSFHIEEEGGDFTGIPLPADTPPPEELVERQHGAFSSLFELRGAFPEGREPWQNRLGLWARTREAFPHDRVMHACGLVFLSDISNGFAEMASPDIPPGGPSLDHAVYFHRPVEIDDWLYMKLEPLSVAGGRGTYHGTIHDRSGRLGATTFQEQLLRPRR